MIRRRKHHTILADVSHPDGFDCSVDAKYYVEEESENNVLEVRRRAGDPVLFYIVFDRLSIWNCGKGQVKKFYDGQICPRVVLRPLLPTPLGVPLMSLDQEYGTKRKYEYLCDGSESSE